MSDMLSWPPQVFAVPCVVSDTLEYYERARIALEKRGADVCEIEKVPMEEDSNLVFWRAPKCK